MVFIGPYEHHSNELPWRESIADVVVIAEDQDGVYVSIAGRKVRPPEIADPLSLGLEKR